MLSPGFIREHTTQVKVTRETETARDELHNQIEQIEQCLYPKRAHTDDDDGAAQT